MLPDEDGLSVFTVFSLSACGRGGGGGALVLAVGVVGVLPGFCA